MVLQKPNFLRSHPSRSHQATPPAPRFESSGCFLHGSFRRKKCQLLHCVKVANPSTLSGTLPFLGGATQSVAGGMGLKSGTLFSRPPNGVQGQRPWHAFGDFRRETKVTRVPSMALPCSRGAPASRVERRGGPQPSSHIGSRRGSPPLQKKPPGERSPPSTYTPKRTKSCIPTCNPGREKSKKGSPLPLLFCRPCAILYLSI